MISVTTTATSTGCQYVFVTNITFIPCQLIAHSHLPVDYFSPLYRELGDALMNVFSRSVVQDRVAGQPLEAHVAGARLAAWGWGASEVVGGKRCVGREEGCVALRTAARPVPRFPTKQNVPRSMRRPEQPQNSPTNVTLDKMSSQTIKLLVVLAITVTLGYESHDLMCYCVATLRNLWSRGEIEGWRERERERETER
jgi:hypothetical protein